MHKLWASTYKEALLLIRDIGGMAILFIMPLVLVITVTLIQDNTFRSINDTKIQILWVDHDQGNVSQSIYGGLEESNAFTLIDKKSGEEARELVFGGKYQLAIVIPPDLTTDLEQKVNRNVEDLLSKFGLEENSTLPQKETLERKEVILYFDPATQMAFKNSIKNGIDKMIFKIETQTIYKAFQSQITDDGTEAIFDTESFITFKEISPGTDENEIIPNSVQHNVPAWTPFAIFFIIMNENLTIYKAFHSQISDDGTEAIFDTESFITFKEISTGTDENEIIPDSVQHNVPAWPLIAIFFIIVPLSINMVKEKSQGTF